MIMKSQSIPLKHLFSHTFHAHTVALVFLSSMAFGNSPALASSKTVAGYLYTSLNGENTNQVISIERLDDGSLGKQIAYSTDSLGGANTNVGGDAAGDFDSQGAMQMIDNYLLVVNAGGNTISVFRAKREDGTLKRQSNVDSGGTRPASIGFVKKQASNDEYWVVVGNQWNNPNVQKGGKGEGALEMYPDAMFHADGGTHEKILPDRNIFLFSFSSSSGVLSAQRSLDTYNGTNGGPTTVAFSSDGSKLAVSTWGIAHFGTETPTHQKPSRIYVYDFDKMKGVTSNRRHFEEDGIAGSIGFSWSYNTSNLYVSNFNLTDQKRNHSLTVLNDDGENVKKRANFGTGNGDDIDEACWTTLNAAGNKLYVSSFGGNFISVFDVAKDGSVSKIGAGGETAFESRRAGTPAGDTKDMLLTSDGNHLYNLGAYQTFTLSQFDIDKKGMPSFNHEYKIEAAIKMGPGQYNFLGLVGFNKE